MLWNETILFSQIILVAVTAFGALRLGKSALVAYSVLLMILANIFVLKQITLLSLHATSADIFVVGSILCFNMLNEFYGPKPAQRMIITTFALSIFFAIISQLHILYVPSPFDVTQAHFEKLFSAVPWLVGGSILIFGITQLLDYLIYSFLKRCWNNGPLIVRNYAALFCAQTFDSVAFTAYMYWLGIIQEPLQITFVSLMIKYIIILLSTPLILVFALMHRRMGHVE